MPSITFNPMGVTVDLPKGTLLLDATKVAGVSIDAPCGGYGICGKCLCQIVSGKVQFENNGIIPASLIESGFVLACKAVTTDEPIIVNVLLKKEKEIGKFLKMSEEMHLAQDELLPADEDLDPIVKHIAITVKEEQMGDGLSDYDRLEQAVMETLSVSIINLPIKILTSLPSLVRENNGKLNVSYYIDKGICNIADIALGESVTHYGIAVDIGTTTIAVSLVNMENGDLVASKTEYNAQVTCGLDIISRINYAKKPERLKELRKKVRDTINDIIKELAKSIGINTNEIMNVSISGNTTMVHLFMGIMPEYIRINPYTPAVYTVPLYKAGELGVAVNNNCPVFFAPSVGSYVGGDITSGILCTSLATDSEDLVLFIDIGTNGEIVIGNNEFLMGCACSAGPAFEGGGLKCGMRASIGAIEKVEIDERTGFPNYSTIGNVPPVGICGSGIISLVAELLRKKWIDPAGKLNRAKPCAFIDTSEKNARYILEDGSHSGSGRVVYITEADIENVMRTKAAIFSACMTMLDQVGMSFSDLAHIYVAGGFGRFLDIDNSQKIGLLPKLPRERFSFLGNSSVLGSYMTLVSKRHREKEYELAQKITYIDLGSEPSYMDHYTAALFLPHTDARLFAD